MKIKSRKVLGARLLSLTSALALALGISTVTAPSAQALVGPNVHLYGTACPGGSIIAMIAVTSNESVYGTFAYNSWDVHLSKVTDSSRTVNFAVKCNNNAWYYPIKTIPTWVTNLWNVGPI